MTTLRAALLAVGLGLASAGIAALVAGAPLPPAALREQGVPVARFAAEGEEPRTVRLAGTARGRDDGRAVAGALVCDHPAFDAPALCAATGPDGRFAFEVPSGLHKLEVLAPPGSSYVDEWFDARDRSRDAALLDLRKSGREDLAVSLSSGRRIGGRLTARRDGSPVADAQACAAPNDRPGEWVCARTDADGRYAMVVPPGTYSVFFVPPDGTRLRTQWWDGGDDILAAEELDVRRRDASGVDGSFLEGNLVTGTVRSFGGRPLERVLVCIDTPLPTGRICRPTDRDGRFLLAVRRGTYVLQFKPPVKERAVAEWFGGAADPKGARSVSVSGEVRIDATLQSGKLLWGRVTTATGQLPIEGATVNVYAADRPCCALTAATITGSGGDYAVIVRPGDYWVEVFPPFGSLYVSAFAGGAPTAERARVVTVGDKEDRNVVDVALEEIQL